jgi:hypothetical protein
LGKAMWKGDTFQPVLSRFSAVLSDGVRYSQERNQMSLDEMVKREVDPKTGRPTNLRALFDYWKERRNAAAFDPKGAFTPEAFRWIASVDVRASDPLSFVFRNHPGYLLGDWSGKTLRQYPNSIHARSLALEYLTCKMVQQASYYEITQTIGSLRRTYMRLLLPVSGGRPSVTRLFYAVRYVRIENGPTVEPLPADSRPPIR